MVSVEPMPVTAEPDEASAVIPALPPPRALTWVCVQAVPVAEVHLTTVC
jgi:hypothetical protein